MRLLITPFLLGLFCFSLAFAAPPAAPRPERAPTAEQTLRQGVELYRGGKQEEALSTLRGFVLRHPDSPLLSEALLYLARIFHDQGELDDALLYVRRIPPERRGAAAHLVEGAALVGTGEIGRGVALLQAITADSLSPSDRKLRFYALAEGSARSGKPLTALSYLQRALTDADPREKEKILGKARPLLRDRLTEEELAQAVSMFSGSAIGEEARLQQSRRAAPRGVAAKGESRPEAMSLQGPKGVGGDGPTVGVILPLSGRYAGFGGLVRRGMELALEGRPDSGVRFHFSDSQGDPQLCARTVGELASDPKVVALAGPLTSAAAAAAAARAQQEKIPLLALSQKEGLPKLGDYVFRLSLTAGAQVRALVDHAVGDKGMTAFAVLAPETRLGEEMSELFTREVERRGGKIVARAGYPENATDFKVQVRQLAGRPPAKSGGAGSPEKKEAEAIQALFIPDTADRVTLVAPQLAYYGLQKVQLLGTNGWNRPELRKAGRHVEGAVFVDGFFAGASSPHVGEFVRIYREKYGQDPSLLEAQAFDVAEIYFSVLADPAVRTRDDVRNALSRLSSFPGVTGETGFDVEGEAQRRPYLLQVRGGEIVQIN